MINVKAIFGILLAAVAAAACAATDRSGTLEVDKECPPSQYTGGPDSYCTFTSSNFEEAPAGSKVFYLQPEDLASDVILVPPGPGEDQAFGRCVLDEEFNGTCTFSGGTGEFEDFEATFNVTYLDDVNWHWEGPYSFGSPPG